MKMAYLTAKNSGYARNQVSNISIYKTPQLLNIIYISVIWKSKNEFKKNREIESYTQRL